jgi:hypothetical protein
MIDILAAARTALPNTPASATTDSGKLFITGYSEGGHVAMATQRALQAAGKPATAAAPMSGPYALEAFGDAVFFGAVDLGSTIFAPLLTTSYQQAYGNIYTATTDVYSAAYAADIATLLPSLTPIETLYNTGLLPPTALFDIATPTVNIPGQPTLSLELTAELGVPPTPGLPLSSLTPLYQSGFGSPGLINDSFRLSYALDAATNPDGAVPTLKPGAPLAAAPTQTFRLALYKNDLRNGNWAPESPTLLCGGDGDPTVYFQENAQVMEAFWSAQVSEGLVSVLDINATPAGPFAAVQAGFQASQAALFAYYQTPAGGSMSPEAAQLQVVEGTHTAEAPFCAAAARAFFSQF